MCSPSPPPAPDYTGAAEATAAGNLDAAKYQVEVNRPDEYTPYGSRTWTKDQTFDQTAYDEALSAWESGRPTPIGSGIGALDALENKMAMDKYGASPTEADFTTDQWRSDIALTDVGQRLFDIDNLNKESMANLSLQGQDQLQDVFGTQFQIDGNQPAYEGPGTYGENRQKTMDAMLARVDEQTEQDRDNKRSQLIAQGIPPGSEAWKREMDQINENLTDARQQAEIAATDQAGREYQSSLAGAGQLYGAETDARSRMIQELMMNRQTPLNEYNAFRTGSQVNMPQFGSYGQMGQVAGPDYTGAAAAQSAYDMGNYNAGVAGSNSLLGTAGMLGAASIMAPVPV